MEPQMAQDENAISNAGDSASVADHEEIARLAYAHWEERGCPLGSPEEDWFRAECELQKQAAAAA